MKRILAWTLYFLMGPLFAFPLSIGTPPFNPPFGQLADDKNHFFGFDIDIMLEICKRISAECSFHPIIFNNLIDSLIQRNIDVAVSGVIITKGRSDAVIYSLPYMESNARFMAMASSSINTPEDIKNKIVGTRLGTPFKALAVDLYNAQIQSKEYPITADLITALNNKSVDIILLDAEAAKYWVNNNSSTYKFVGSDIPLGSGYGIMARNDKAELIGTINKALLAMEADGTYLSIYTRYFGESMSILPVKNLPLA